VELPVVKQTHERMKSNCQSQQFLCIDLIVTLCYTFRGICRAIVRKKRYI